MWKKLNQESSKEAAEAEELAWLASARMHGAWRDLMQTAALSPRALRRRRRRRRRQHLVHLRDGMFVGRR